MLHNRVSVNLRIDEDIDKYIRAQVQDTLRGRIRHGGYADLVNMALRSWMDTHKKLMSEVSK